MDRAALAHKCERIEMAGGSVLDYLRSIGCISPWGTWHRLQKEELCRANHQIKDGKGNKEMRRYTAEEKQEAVNIALRGDNPLPYLKSIGSERPDNTWYMIKKALKETDPEVYARIQDFRMKKVTVPDEVMEELRGGIPAENPVTTCCVKGADSCVEVPEEIGSEVKIDADGITVRKAENPYAGLTVTGLKTDYGEFRLSNNGYLYFGSNQHDELEMPVELWLRFRTDLPRIMELLGIK